MAGKKIAVYGLGATGLSVCDALIASGAEVFAFDEDSATRNKTVNTKYAACHPKEWPWKELSSLVLSPGVPLHFPKAHVVVRKARQEKVEIIGDVELFARSLAAINEADRPRVIAITGSNGKSTTTALVGHILKESGRNVHIGGNIGEPLLRLPSPSPGAIYVLELSSFQLDLTTSFRPNTAVLLNVTPDHIDRHGDFENYVAAKKRIFAKQTIADLSILNADNAACQSVFAELSSRSRRICPVSAEGSLGRGYFALGGKLFYSQSGKSGEAGDISKIDALRGRHNWLNASAALAAVHEEGVAPAVAIRSMERFRSLPHRLEVVARKGKVTFVNDSKATNAEATVHALRAYDDIFWIVGGRAKDGGVTALRGDIDNVRGAYLIGEAARDFEGQLAGDVACVQCGDLKSAISRAYRDAIASDCIAPAVILSPACASFDQFTNFMERGERFRDYALQIISENGAAA